MNGPTSVSELDRCSGLTLPGDKTRGPDWGGRGMVGIGGCEGLKRFPPH